MNAGWVGTFIKLEKHLNTTDVVAATAAVTKDSQGQLLSEGDTVKTIKDLKVKGSSMVVKRGTVVKNIRLLPDSPSEIDCKVDGVGLHLETQWLLKM
ncbi:MAG: alkylphosphonate utilization protein [Bdellovibrionaceae bacterium]|nr:alkylphosphonate utilization protein [Pseudobdellovibrionaceae bacterium]